MTSNSKDQADTPPPGSEGEQPYVIPGSMKPIDIECLPLEQQAILQVIAKESQKAEERGEIDGAEYTITREQVDAELEKLRKEKRRSKR
jgi:hypothetical protein